MHRRQYNVHYDYASRIRKGLGLISISDVTFPLISHLNEVYLQRERQKKEEEQRIEAAKRVRRQRAERYHDYTAALAAGTATASESAYWDTNPVQPAETQYIEQYLQPEQWSPAFNIGGTPMIGDSGVDYNGNLYGYDPGPSNDPFND